MNGRDHGVATAGASPVVTYGAVVIVVLLFGAFLFSPCCPDRRAAMKSNCRSNLKQIGSAFKMYLEDWHDTYPTNRPRYANGRLGRISCDVRLTPVKELTPGKKSHNLSWVEGLYPYMEMPSDDSYGAWECRSASKAAYPEDSKTAYTTYVMNGNLVEQPEGCIRRSDQLMLAREADRHVNAELRPTNQSFATNDVPPDSPFLTSHDSRLGKTNADLHSGGSHILFADSHVKYVDSHSMPDRRQVRARDCWDAKDGQWYNYSDNASDVPKADRKSIAITP